MDFGQFKKKYQKKEVREYPNRVTSTPLVSVMVQTYQHKEFIKDCLESILKQETNFPFEILLGEDFSSDGTREICMEYAQRYPDKIRLFLHHPENKIRVLNITTGNFNALYNFYSARGEFIAFCEGDDLWMDPLKLQKQVDVLVENSDLSLTYHSYIEVDILQKPLSKELVLDQPEQDISKEDLKKLTFHPLLSTICFRNFGNELPEQMAEVINVDSFLLSLLGNYGAGEFIESIVPSYYRRHGGGIWSEQKKELKFRLKIKTLHHLIKFYDNKYEPEILKVFQQKRNSTLKQLLFHYLKQGKIVEVIRLLTAKGFFIL